MASPAFHFFVLTSVFSRFNLRYFDQPMTIQYPSTGHPASSDPPHRRRRGSEGGAARLARVSKLYKDSPGSRRSPEAGTRSSHARARRPPRRLAVRLGGRNGRTRRRTGEARRMEGRNRNRLHTRLE